MLEKTLLKIALISSLLGVAILFFITDRIDASQLSIEELNTPHGDRLGEYVKILGRIDKIYETDGAYFLTIAEDKVVTTTAVVFKRKDTMPLEVGDYVEIKGTIEQYKGKNEIISDEIKRLD